jgi:hypothetical protein
MELSRFFTLDELTRSETAQRFGLSNDPPPRQIENLKALCRAVLDPLRDAIGQPVKVNSGYRAPAVNKKIGGASDSQHLHGMAADIQSPGSPVLELFKRIITMGLPFDQIIYEAVNARTKWVHVSHNATHNRGDIRIARFGPNGKPVGYPKVTAEQALAIQEPAMRGLEQAEPSYIEIDDAPVTKPAVQSKPKMKKAKSTIKKTQRKAKVAKAVTTAKKKATKDKVVTAVKRTVAKKRVAPGAPAAKRTTKRATKKAKRAARP